MFSSIIVYMQGFILLLITVKVQQARADDALPQAVI